MSTTAITAGAPDHVTGSHRGQQRSRLGCDAFVIDYAARLYLSRQRWLFVRTHLLDLLVIAVPMLRPLRALRLLRLLRLVSLAGLANRQAQRSLHARVSAYVMGAAVVVVVSAGAMFDAERSRPDGNIKSFPDALWWAATTVTTVGYGDRYPTTTYGRLVAVGLMLMGIALLGVLTANIAAWLVARLQAVEAVEERTEANLENVLAELRLVRAELAALRDAQRR